MSNQAILAFDTSGPFCSVALHRDDRVISEAYADMARGQAEALMPMVADLMDEAKVGRRHLRAVGVGIGPGNFTGLRIAVAAARGMALGLGIPAIGVSAFEVLLASAGSPKDQVLLSLPAPRDQVYLHLSENGQLIGDGWLATPETHGVQAAQVIGDKADIIAGTIDSATAEVLTLPRPAPFIATLAAGRDLTARPRPAPFYIRPADAAPSRHKAPVRLP